ncbi:sialate O-acetylesterase [Flavobacterium piscis]|uniref:Sialate O-acetylesterase n=1 Tax=Flavobacterium piscis TaxID=1114874 RepID=A0ABU1Y7S4_9FLAO|nr:sialate O-acetylesterase [Flavobacterium piscis]MDR7210282.1 hypothetical protein [Flavobacterium piscis]
MKNLIIMNAMFFSRIILITLLWVTTTSCGNANDDIEPLLDISKKSISLPAEGGTTDITVTSNDHWSVNGVASWLQLSKTSGNGGDIAIKLTAELNVTGSTRSAILNISLNNGKILRTVYVSQVSKDVAVTPKDPNFYIFLCFGQSNMHGAAPIESQDKVGNSRFKLLQPLDCPNLNRTKATWYTAVAPTCQCGSGLSPADYFGRTMVEKLPDNITVGIINVSVAGCDIRLFDKDKYLDYDSTSTDSWFTNQITGYNGSPYQYLIDLAKLAQKDGVIKGILLHQGETNNGQQQWPSYVKKIYGDMMTDLSLNANSVPLLAGELFSGEKNCCSGMNPIIRTLPNVISTAHVISSDGCTGQDSAHFDSNGYRELGRRYGFEMLRLLGVKL